MATASKIKSAIRSRGAAQRNITQQLAGVSEQLLKAEESLRLNEFRAKEEAVGFASVFSGLEAGSTYLETLRQDQELKSNIEAFEQSLPESVRQAGGVTIERGAKSSLMDVFTGRASMSDYLHGQEKYMLGERELGTKYDVSAMGEKVKAMKQADLLDQFFGEGEPLPKSTVSRGLGMKKPSLEDVDFTKLYGDFEEKPSMMDKVGDKIKDGTLVKSDDGNIVPEKVVEKTKEVPSGIAKDVKDYENEKLAEFIPDIFKTEQEDALGPVTEEIPVVENNFREKAVGYTFKEPKTWGMKSPSGGAKKLKDKIKDLKTVQENLKGLRPEDKFNRKKFEKLVKERTSELQSLISEVYNPELDIFYGDDSTESITLRSELGSDSISFIKQLASK